MRSFAKLLKENTQGSGASARQVTSVVPMDHAEISRDGLRAVDSGVFKVPSRIESNIGDEYKYIQDVADATHLRGAYLFQGSCLDESGYNNDPIDQTSGNNGESGFTDFDGLDYTLNTTANNKFKGIYGATVASNAKGAIIPNKFLKDGTTNVFDFSGDFDIFCWVTAPASGGAGTIFSKINSATEGIKISLSRDTSTSPDSFKAIGYFHTTNSGIGNESINSGSSRITYGESALVRFQRKGKTFNLWLVNGSESTPFGTPNGTYNSSNGSRSTGSFSVPTDATIGSQASAYSGNTVTNTTNSVEAYMHSIRIYSNVLDIQSANQIFSSRPVPLIMKLAGSLYKMESSIDQKKLYVKGFGKVIIDSVISNIILDGTVADGEWYNPSSHTRSGVNFTNCSSVEIIRAIFAHLNRTLEDSPTFTLSVRDLTSTSNSINSYAATGNFLEIIDQLMTIVNKSFYVSPRGKCIIEEPNIDLTSTLKFGKMYNVSADGFDDTTTVNDLYVSTRISGNFNIIHRVDTDSIDLIGLYSKRIFVPQITDGAAAGTFGTNFITLHADINSRYTIVAPFLIDFVRENFRVKVTNTTKNLDVNTTIKSITWTYPEGKTTIETGDFLLDAFDIEKTSAEAISNLVTDTNLNP
jgi:hypothetical protein|tara:strand:+ start:2114 stop:4030 length:1917 start_codon:yes stop_codon:yes gene_type:complete